jgi:hypothetical protein
MILYLQTKSILLTFASFLNMFVVKKYTKIKKITHPFLTKLDIKMFELFECGINFMSWSDSNSLGKLDPVL